MLVSLNWIKKYTKLPDDLSMDQLAYDLTMRTVEVEDWYNPADRYQGVVLGEIIRIDAHPQADKLRVCYVDVAGEDLLQIVCGGTNLRVGQLVVVAVAGSMVRWHGEGEPVEIKKTKLRGVESQGMICASNELDLGALFPAEADAVIMDLTDFPGAEKGLELADVLGLHDMIIEIDNKSLTNRPDLWGHYGIARELSAIYGTALYELPQFSHKVIPESYSVQIEDLEDCPRYAASVWKDIKNSESPYELKKTLYLLGHSSHGLIVDLTNYVMLAVGQPNHAYDYARVGDEIIIRRAKNSEQLTLLDDIDLTLDENDLVIARSDKAIGLAGVKGGLGDSISEDTKDIVFEVANFKPIMIRKTSQKHKVHTDAAARFEKGLDIPRVDQAMGLFEALVKKYSPETKLVAYVDPGQTAAEEKRISCHLERISRRLGKKLSLSEVNELLTPLGFVLDSHTVDGEKTIFTLVVPSWRATGDVEGEADIVEELARMIGYENFEFSPPKIELKSAVEESIHDLDRAIREYLAFRCGLQEVIVYPWTEETYQAVCRLPDEDSVPLTDPPSPEEKFLDQSLVPGLVKAAKKNERYYNEFSIFNVAEVFKQNRTEEATETGEVLPLQEKRVAALFFGQDAWKSFRKLKGILEHLPRHVLVEEVQFSQKKKPEWADPEVYLNILNQEGEVIGDLGLLSAYAKRNLGFKRGDMAICEFSLAALEKVLPSVYGYEEVPNYPLVELDFTVLCDEGVKWSDILKYLAKSVYRIEYIGEYRDEKIGQGKKSLTFRVQFGKEDGTLSGEEIEDKRKSLLNTLKHTVGIELRE